MNIENLKEEIQLDKKYIIYEIKEDEEVDNVGIGMVTNNAIKGLIPSNYLQLNSRKEFQYDITDFELFLDILEKGVTGYQLQKIIMNMVDTMMNLNDYMLDEKNLCLDKRYIYVKDDIVMFLYLPIKCNAVQDMKKFLKDILISSRIIGNENTSIVSKILIYTNEPGKFSVFELKKILESNPKQEVTPQPNSISNPVQPSIKEVQTSIKSESVGKEELLNSEVKKVSPVVENKITSSDESKDEKISLFYLLQHYNKENAAKYKAQKESKSKEKSSTGKKVKKGKNKDNINYNYDIPGQKKKNGSVDNNIASGEQENVNTLSYMPPKASSSPADFGETTVLIANTENNGETTVLTADQLQQNQPIAFLIRKKTNEKIMLDKARFRIGKEKSNVDYFIGDNSAISRRHADIVNTNGTYFIIDMKSTNHVFVNGNIIPIDSEIQIYHGDSIQLGNEEFEFKMY